MPDEGADRQAENVRRLRELHWSASGDDRQRAGTLLGLAITELTVNLDDADPDLAGLAREGLAVLVSGPADETGNEPGPQYLDRARSALSARLAAAESAVAGPTVAGPTVAGLTVAGPAVTPGSSPAWVNPAVVATQAMAGKPMMPQGFSPMGSGADVEQFRQLVQMARTMLPSLPADHPMRAQLRLVIGFSDGLEAAASGQWTEANDITLNNLRLDAAGAATTMDPRLHTMMPALLAMMGVARGHAKQQSPIEQEHLNAIELDELIAELEAVAGSSAFGEVPGGEQIGPVLLFMTGYFLVLRAGYNVDEKATWSDSRDPATTELLARARRYLKQAPPEYAAEAQRMLSLLDVSETGPDSSDQAISELVDLAEEYGDVAATGLVVVAMNKAEKARRTRRPEDLAAAIGQLREVRKRLGSGHPQHGDLLAMLANLLGLRASLTQSATDCAEAITAGIEALRAAEQPSLEVAGHLVAVLGIGMMADLRVGPFESAEREISETLERVGFSERDAWLRLSLNTGLGAARLLRWRGSQDPAMMAAARAALDEAERLLPPPIPTDQWLGPAGVLMQVNLAAAIFGADPAAGAAAGRQIESLERLVTQHPDLATRMAAGLLPGGLAKLGLNSDGPGLLQALGMMRSMLPGISGAGLFGGIAQRMANPQTNRNQVETILDEFRRGEGPNFDLQSFLTNPQAMSGDPAAMMHAVSQLISDNPGLVDSVLASAAGSKVPPAPPPAAVNRRLTERGLARAGHALRCDGQISPARPALAPQDSPDPGALLAAVADLRAGLAGGLDDDELVHEARGRLGICLAELHWLGVPDPGAAGDLEAGAQTATSSELTTTTLLAAIRQLDVALSSSGHALPTVHRAELLDVQARCYRRLSGFAAHANVKQDAERIARAALGELVRCVILADRTDQALRIASRANEMVGRVVGWCLLDNRPNAAIEVAEGGRSLLLASVVLAGRVESLLRAVERDDVADEWRTGSTAGRLAGLQAISASFEGQMMLVPPTVQQISSILMTSAAAFDAVVYLIPASLPDAMPGGEAPSSGYALLVRPGFAVEVLALPGASTGPETPIPAYLSQFAAAVAGFDAGQVEEEGFRGTPGGRAWATKLDELGSWTHQKIIDPLVRQARTWKLTRTPHLALIPLGELAAIPYAAAWTADQAMPGGRRYAVHDLVLSYAASARVLIDVAARPRAEKSTGTVLIGDATNEFPFSRRAALAVGEQYEVAKRRFTLYGRREKDPRAPGGAATTDRILAALLGTGDQPPAAVVHYTTHGATQPNPRLQTADGWLTLAQLLDQGRERVRHSAGSLLITSACLTDATDSHYDESVTLATALLTACATGVIGTRWQIDDDTNAVLALHLHDQLLAGARSPAHALREAQLALLDPRRPPHPRLSQLKISPDPARWAHPASWAGYVHHGC